MFQRIRRLNFKTSPLPPPPQLPAPSQHVQFDDRMRLPEQPSRFARLTSLARARSRPRPVEVPAMAPIYPNSQQAVDTPRPSRMKRLSSRLPDRTKSFFGRRDRSLPPTPLPSRPSTPAPTRPPRRFPLRPAEKRMPIPHTGQGDMFFGFLTRNREVREKGALRRAEVERMRLDAREARRRQREFVHLSYTWKRMENRC
ncbi:hypothetical protein BDY24DRAFT_373707 [Mrakia frigida]|uniref:uncharacterized protein n=1 Tax=Mrakia frigida TaxID=29902 RepID=UPI003FCBFA1D